MIGKVLQHAKTFGLQEILRFFPVALIRWTVEGTPERNLRLQIDTQQICCCECGFRRTAGVKTIMIDAEILGYFHHMEPARNSHGSIACQGEDHTVMFSAQKGLSAVDPKVSAIRSKGAYSG